MWSKDFEQAVAGRGRPADDDDDDARRRMLEAMAERHPFPGYYPVVVIGVAGDDFRAALIALIETHEAVDSFRYTERASSMGSYVSYHLECYVVHAEAALDVKDQLALLEGVRALL